MAENHSDETRQEILQVHFNIYPPVGPLVVVLRDLQTALRAAARSAGESAPSRSIQARGFSEGSLDFTLEVVGWTPYLVQVATELLPETLKEVLQNGPAITLTLVLQLMESRRRRRRELHEDSQLDRIEQAIPLVILPEESQEADRRNRRRTDIEELSKKTGYPEATVAEAIRVVDRITDAAEGIGSCDGGFLKPRGGDSLVVPPNWRRKDGA